jgi:hypothetical protein
MPNAYLPLPEIQLKEMVRIAVWRGDEPAGA